MTIRDYHDKETAAFVNGEHVRQFEQCRKGAAKAIMKLQAVSRLIELRNPPSNHFEALTSDSGRYSIRIDRKWRVCFRWAPIEPLPPDADRNRLLMAPGEPYDVEITSHYD